MPKEPIFREGIVTDVAFPNRGIMQAAVEGSAAVPFTAQTIHVKGALPGQTIRVTVGRTGKRRREGRLQEVLKPAPYEIDPPCPHAAVCGGCCYQTVPYELQLTWKEQQVKKLLEPVLESSNTIWEPIAPSPLVEGYRNKMEFSFGDEIKDGPLTLGLHKRGAFHDIVPTPGCRIIHPDMARILSETQQYFAATGASHYNTYTHGGFLRHLVLRRSFLDGQILVNLITTSAEAPDLTPWTNRLLSLPLEGSIGGILHTVNDRQADVVQSDALEILYGKASLTESLLGLSFEIFPFSFFQTNSKGAERLYSVVRDFAGDVSGAEVFDLYCGTGTIAQILAGAGAASVTGIEIVKEAVDAARINAGLNGLNNCRFIAGDVLKEIDTLEIHPDLVILDPPRDGIHPKALPKILKFAPDRFIYVSCKPTSLVRDLPFFQEAGYTVERIRTVDMFPFTYHVETVVLMVRQKTDRSVLKL